MKKIWLLTTLLTTATLLAWCNINVNINNSKEEIPLEDRVPGAVLLTGQSWSQDITWDNTNYYNQQYWISLRLGEAYKSWFVHQENWEDFSTLTFFIPDETATKEETHIDGYRDVVTIYMVPIKKNDEFKEYKSWTNIEDMGLNNKYYFYTERKEVENKADYYTDNLIFSI